MGIAEKLKEIAGNKRSAAGIVLLGAVGVFLLVLSELSDGKERVEITEVQPYNDVAQSFCRESEERLEAFLENIEGAGEVEVYLTVASGERYIYASEKKLTESENKRDSEEKYVLVGGSSSREPLVETVRTPEITGAVIICRGCGSPVVEERMYKAASAALGLPTADIYVTTMK
jgi:stage III sporulation protein AG